jgi:hypothetical protein
MKYLIFVMTLATFSQNALAREIPHIRIFEIDWKASYLEDSDVQMCDDGYYNAAEFVFRTPSRNEPALRKALAEACPDFKLGRAEILSGASTYGFRIKATGAWNCEVNFEDQSSGKVFNVVLGDAC